MSFSNMSKTELLAFPPHQICFILNLPSLSFPGQKIRHLLWLTLLFLSHLIFNPSANLIASSFKIHSKSDPFFPQPWGPSHCSLSPGLLPSNWFPCSYRGYLQFIFSTAATVKNMCQMSHSKLHWFPISLTVKTEVHRGALHLPTSLPTVLSLAQPLWPHCCSSNMPDRLLSQDLPSS